MPAPSSCPGNQPTALKVEWNEQTWVIQGGGSTCSWTDGEGYVDLYLDDVNEIWALEISGAAEGGPSAGFRNQQDVRGNYDNGAVVSDA